MLLLIQVDHHRNWLLTFWESFEALHDHLAIDIELYIEVKDFHILIGILDDVQDEHRMDKQLEGDR